MKFFTGRGEAVFAAYLKSHKKKHQKHHATSGLTDASDVRTRFALDANCGYDISIHFTVRTLIICEFDYISDFMA